LTPIDASERQNQFSGHALNGARRNGFCLLATSELFKAVCSVLENPNDELKRNEIRNSILSKIGTWHFESEVASLAQLSATNEECSPGSSQIPANLNSNSSET
jgi:hypothetical protein